MDKLNNLSEVTQLVNDRDLNLQSSAPESILLWPIRIKSSKLSLAHYRIPFT